MDAPFSRCDAKGRCIRHPTVQMSRKKKLGGWKKLLSNCPMCAIELVAEGGEGCAYVGDIATPAASSSRHVEPHRGGRLARPTRQHSDDRSIARSTASAPSAYHRRSSHDSGRSMGSLGPSAIKRDISGDSSCDSTVDMSYSSHCSESHHSSASRDRRRELRAPRVGHHDDSHDDVNTIRRNEEQFVCGMEFERRGSHYTGQVHFESRLPHGLGTLRRADGTVREGEWQNGRLVQQSRTTSPYSQERENQEEYACKNYDDYRMPCTGGRPVSHGQANCYEDSLSANLQRQCHFETNDESSVSPSVAETVHDDETGSQSSWSRSSSHSPHNSSYSARESKASPAPSISRATYNKLQEFEQYVIRCDEEADWYQDDESSRASRTSYSQCSGIVEEDHYSRPRRVRFREDP